MASLFGMPTPGEVRQQARAQLFGSLGQQGGTFGPAFTGMSRIGALFGHAMAGPSAAEQRAMKIQGIQQQVLQDFGGMPSDEAGIGEMGKSLASALMKAGETEMALNVYGKVAALKPAEDKKFEQGKVDKLRKAVSGNKQVKDFMQVDEAFESIKSFSKIKTVQADQGMIFTWMKVLDPNSTVREGEYATAQDTTALPSWLVGLYNKTVDGEMLLDSEREKFVDAAEVRRDVSRQSADTAIGNVLQLGQQDEVMASNILGSRRFEQYQARQKLYDAPEGMEDLWPVMSLREKRKYMGMGK